MDESDQNVSPSLVEGVDYYIEHGQRVFTAYFHLKRGFCCGNKCRHCPYGTQSDSVIDARRNH